MKAIQKFIRDEDGVTAIEYALIAVLIAIAIVGSVTSLGGQLNTVFSTVKTKLNVSA